MDQSSVVYKWLRDNELFIDGRPKNIDDMFEQAEELRNKPEEEEEEEAPEILTYYETHDFDEEEYYGSTEAVTAAPQNEPVTEEEVYE